MAKIQSITKPVSNKSKQRRSVTLIAQATDRHPGANPNPKGALSMLAADIRKQGEYLQNVYELMGMDNDNPILAGSGFLSLKSLNPLKRTRAISRILTILCKFRNKQNRGLLGGAFSKFL